MSPINMGFANPEVWALASNGSEIYAGVNGVGLYKSIDNGASWNLLNNGISSSNFSCIALNGQDVFISATGGVFHSNNGVRNGIQLIQD
ncbi:MAG: hypothetical protein IPK10_04065 [Bacteroidetes bacterium]|nr:hypothetical protein [Bacteroidota bacterium]